jgi:zinc-ribbon domain
MRLFNGRAATEDYMSTHSLTFSTPELTLKKFALWLGEPVNSPKVKGQHIPRLMTYLEEKDKGSVSTNDLMPDISDNFEPSGAVTDMFHGISTSSSTNEADTTTTTKLSVAAKSAPSEDKYCIECGSKLKTSSKFCTKCGARQE